MSTIETEINLKEVVKSILFVAGEGIEKSLIAEKLDVPESKIYNYCPRNSVVRNRFTFSSLIN